MYTIIEHLKFQCKAREIWTEEERLEFFSYIAQNPLVGDVIKHADGLRKVRWQANGKGKRGGVRVIYFNLLEDGVVIMMDIYAKNEKREPIKPRFKTINRSKK